MGSLYGRGTRRRSGRSIGGFGGACRDRLLAVETSVMVPRLFLGGDRGDTGRCNEA